jgi:hypothetical protein
MPDAARLARVVVFGGLLALAACSAEPGSERWCEQKKEQSKSEWSGSDLVTFTRHCVVDGSAVGSEDWCKELEEKPKGEWTANETATYTKSCIM